MPSLGDSFPPEKKEDYFKRNVTVGAVIRIFCDFTNPPKPKPLVIVCMDPKVLCFLINSEIHPFIKKRAELRASQILMPKESHSFLDHDSFIDCTEAKEFSLEDIKSQIFQDMSCIKGESSAEVKKIIVTTVSSSSTISPRDKKWILDNLK